MPARKEKTQSSTEDEQTSSSSTTEQQRPQQSRRRITEGQVADVQRLVPTPIKEEERKALNLWQKRARMIDELGTVPKRGYNDHHKYAYALEADVVAYLGPLMAKYAVVVNVDVISQMVPVRQVAHDAEGTPLHGWADNGIPAVERIEIYETRSGSKMYLTRLPLRITIINADKPDERETILWVGEGADTADKGVYKSYTGALKYFYMKWFMIATGDDPEAFERVDELAEGAGTRQVRVESSNAQQPEKGGRQRETSGSQIRQLGAMSRAMGLGGEDQTERIRATAAYVDQVLGTKVREQLGELEGDDAEKAFKQFMIAIPGEDTGKVLYRMGEDVRKKTESPTEAEVTDEATVAEVVADEAEATDSEEGLPD